MQTSADGDVDQASSSETQQGWTLHVPRLAATNSLVELDSSRGEHSEQSWWSSDWMTEAVAEEAETSAIDSSRFLQCLRESIGVQQCNRGPCQQDRVLSRFAP